MSAPDAAARHGSPRFTRAERITHWVNADALGSSCIATGAMFRFGIGQSLHHRPGPRAATST